MSELSPRQLALKEEFTRARGYWSPTWDQVLALDPDFFEAYMNFSSVPWRHGVLEPKVREFIYIAIDASTTHLHAPGTRVHMKNALRYGATRQEIMEVLQLISVLGIHSVTHGVPILVEELAAAGRGVEVPKPGQGGEREARLKAEFTAARGYWSGLWDNVLALSPDFFEAYLRFSSVPWQHGMLEPKVKEFIYIAIDAATTHLYAPGTRIHIRNALKHGATRQEIMEVLELVSVLGIHSTTHGVPILLEELKAAGQG
ncbi:carboxymuconolactone decarboxylase family protein [Siccirubricoccus sp. KC 17139]|uniref:Carboxymuconolactone decarboxylase family protein n=1 Tax=Siccirubricoccus soli TaxID=2899147 RepID=A0ABT1DDL8_9PROT|nr:carboxymuconolactone decarboxylase family protein [Siccirubricoccus soli]MCO6419040.1 carboxymuconolactone decarboxylase family protein [Siccirubricoccus soli]MCP2685175.1 carboxymuconolactone decarboxylase family protein [Siccirubricoccus soli]